MAWSSYAHLPNEENEYRSILSELKNEMSVSEVDEVIAKVKGKGHVSHHYRSNLARIGLFDVRGGKVYLNYDATVLKREKPYLISFNGNVRRSVNSPHRTAGIFLFSYRGSCS